MLASKLNRFFPVRQQRNIKIIFTCLFCLLLTNIGLVTNDDLDLRGLKGSNSNSLVTAEVKPADSCLVWTVKAATPKL